MKKHLQCLAGASALLISASMGSAALITSHTDADPSTGATVDGVLSTNEYGPGNSYVYTGGGGGFGGTLGNGSLYLNRDATNLYVGFQQGNSLNDNVVIHMDTRAGGFSDAQMNDTADPGRNLLTNLTRDVDDPFPVGMTNGLPDFGIVIGTFGIVSFELTTGSLNFINFSGTFTGNAVPFREYAIPLASIGSPSVIDFFVSYGSNSNFMSNESIPPDAFNAGGNPGFDNVGTGLPLVHSNFDRFVSAPVPEPATAGLLVLGGAAMLIRRRRQA
jgi:hypothetical protein